MNFEKSPIENRGEEEKEPLATLPKEATFADLFEVMESDEESEELADLFEQELEDNFGSEILDEVLSFESTQKDKATTTKIIDFFKKRGYSQEDVSVYLPIKFKDNV